MSFLLLYITINSVVHQDKLEWNPYFGPRMPSLYRANAHLFNISQESPISVVLILIKTELTAFANPTAEQQVYILKLVKILKGSLLWKEYTDNCTPAESLV